MYGSNNLGQSITGLYQNMSGSANLGGQIGSLYGNQAMNVNLGNFESNKLDFGMKLGSGSSLDKNLLGQLNVNNLNTIGGFGNVVDINTPTDITKGFGGVNTAAYNSLGYNGGYGAAPFGGYDGGYDDGYGYGGYGGYDDGYGYGGYGAGAGYGYGGYDRGYGGYDGYGDDYGYGYDRW